MMNCLIKKHPKGAWCKIASVTLFLFLVACRPVPPKYPLAMNDIQTALQQGIVADQQQKTHKKNKGSGVPAAVNAALIPELSAQQQLYAQSNEEHRFDVAVKDLPARTFFMGLVQGTDYNMVVSPEVNGKISMSLKNVTVHEALEATRDAYGYEYRKTPYGFEVLPQELVTRIFTVNYLDVKRKGNSQTVMKTSELSAVLGTTTIGNSSATNQANNNIPSGGAQGPQIPSSGSSVTTESEADFWKALTSTLKTIVGEKEGRSVIVNTQAGVIVVKALPSELRQVSRYLERTQVSLQRQVVIEAKILEVVLNDSFQAGIDWKLLGAQQQGNTVSSSGNMVSLSLSGHNGDFTSVINMLETQGNVQTLSSPRISTVNNQKAVIKVGGDEFFVTSITSNTTGATGTNVLGTSQSVGLTPFFSGITLDVTPQVSNSGEIILHIHPAVSQVQDQVKTIGLGQQTGTLTLPLAQSTIRESDSIVRAQSGQVIVLGGLMQNAQNEKISATPGLTKVPFAGALFRNTKQQSLKTELVILLRPVVVNDKTWPEVLKKASNNFRGYTRGFHAGGRPTVFGTMGEAVDP